MKTQYKAMALTRPVYGSLRLVVLVSASSWQMHFGPVKCEQWLHDVSARGRLYAHWRSALTPNQLQPASRLPSHHREKIFHAI